VVAASVMFRRCERKPRLGHQTLADYVPLEAIST
jgi:hypothetical protein